MNRPEGLAALENGLRKKALSQLIHLLKQRAYVPFGMARTDQRQETSGKAFPAGLVFERI